MGGNCEDLSWKFKSWFLLGVFFNGSFLRKSYTFHSSCPLPAYRLSSAVPRVSDKNVTYLAFGVVPGKREALNSVQPGLN